MAVFITFEGPEGGGKSTTIAAMTKRLGEKGLSVFQTREPGAGKLGAQIRSLLLNGDGLTPETELLLFLADRSNHVASLVMPALEKGTLVLCDRFSDSTLVYQGVGRRLDPEFVVEANRFATRGLTPNLTLLFDIDPQLGLARVTDKDRLDSEPLEFHQRVRDGFLTLARKEPGRWKIIDASQPREVVIGQAEDIILQSLKLR